MSAIFLVLVLANGVTGPLQMLSMEHCQAVARSAQIASETFGEALCLDMATAVTWRLRYDGAEGYGKQ